MESFPRRFTWAVRASRHSSGELGKRAITVAHLFRRAPLFFFFSARVSRVGGGSVACSTRKFQQNVSGNFVFSLRNEGKFSWRAVASADEQLEFII